MILNWSCKYVFEFPSVSVMTYFSVLQVLSLLLSYRSYKYFKILQVSSNRTFLTIVLCFNITGKDSRFYKEKMYMFICLWPTIITVILDIWNRFLHTGWFKIFNEAFLIYVFLEIWLTFLLPVYTSFLKEKIPGMEKFTKSHSLQKQLVGPQTNPSQLK